MQVYKKTSNLLIGLLLVLLTSVSYSYELKPFSLNLDAKKFSRVNISLGGSLTLINQRNDQWEYSVQTLSSLIKLAETSEFIWSKNKVSPLKYTSYSRIAFVKQVDTTNFDDKSEKIVVTRKKNKKAYPYNANIMDPNSFQIKMMQELTEGKTHFSYLVQEIGRQVTYHFQVLKSENLKTPMGNMKVLKLEQVWDKETNKEKYYWVSEEYGFIPLLIESYKNGKIESRIRVTGGSYDGKAIIDLPSN